MMPMQTTYACEAVWNDFETSYNGWYGNADHVILTAQEGTGFQSAKAMQVSGRRSASDGAASAKGLYLSGGTEYDYSVMVYSDTAEEFSLSLLCIDDEIGAETTTVLASETVNAGTWTKLSASFEALEDTYEYLLTLTTDSVSDFRFDDVRITSDQLVNTVSAASADKGLKDAFAGYFRFGSTLNNETVKNSQLTAMVLREYNSITCGNQMKPDYMMVQSESKNNNVSISLKSCAAIMDFCVQNNIGIRGHTLVWHAQTSSWFFKEDFRSDGGWVDEKTMDIRLENYIRNVFAAIEEQYPTLDLYAYDVCPMEY